MQAQNLHVAQQHCGLLRSLSGQLPVSETIYELHTELAVRIELWLVKHSKLELLNQTSVQCSVDIGLQG